MRKLTHTNFISEWEAMQMIRLIEERIDFHNDELRRLKRDLTKLIEEI